jgi:hypothetical protein
MGSGDDKRNRVVLDDGKRLWVETYKDEPQAGNASANNNQVGGNHYKTGGEEHWDRVARLELNYYEGQITRYIERCRKKENMVNDLRKAAHFIEKYIELVETGVIKDPTRPEPKKMFEDNMKRVNNHSNTAGAFLASTI